MQHEQLWAARDREDWNTLWLEAETTVRFIVGRMYARGEVHNAEREDVTQEGMLAAGIAIRSWEPIEGSFGTWISHAVKGRVLNYLNKQSRKHLANADIENLADGDAPEAEVLAETGLIRKLLSRLDLREQQIVERCYGIDCPLESQDQVARSKGLSPQRVSEILALALKKMGLGA